MFVVLPLARLKKKSQSVDISDESFAASLVKDPVGSPIIRNIARATISEEHENNTTNVQKGRSPRRGELKRGYTIGKSMRCNCTLTAIHQSINHLVKLSIS